MTLTSKRRSLAGLTGRVFVVLVNVQERRVSCEGTYSKLLLRCEPPAQRPAYCVVNRTVKYLHTHKSYFILQSEGSKMENNLLYLMCSLLCSKNHKVSGTSRLATLIYIQSASIF